MRREARVLEVSFRISKRDAAAVSARLFDAGAGAVEERPGPELVVWAQGRAALERLSSAAGVAPSAVRELDDSWQTEWMRWLGPVALTERSVLQPTSDRSALPKGKRRIWYEPDQAFGVGTHSSTRLAARSVEALARGRRVLDVGAGNGVLAILAMRAGARRASGIDIDPVAVRAARRNARLNRVRCTFSTRRLSELSGPFDLVVANVEVWVLLELAPDLARVVAREGRLVLSGLLADREPEVVAAFDAWGLSPLERGEEEGWVGLTLGKPGQNCYESRSGHGRRRRKT